MAGIVKTRGRSIERWAPLLVGIVLVSGCAQVPPVRSIRAARYYATGTRALELGDVRGAIRSLERAAVLMPDASEVRNHLGLAYWSDGRTEDALRELERSVELDCDNEAARTNLLHLREELAVAPARLGQTHGG